VLGQEHHVDVGEVARQAVGRDDTVGFGDDLVIIETSVVAGVVRVDPAAVLAVQFAAVRGQRAGVADGPAELDPVADVPVGPVVLVQRRVHVAVLAACHRHVSEVGGDDVLVGGRDRVARRVPEDRRDDHRAGRWRPHHRAAVEEQWRSAVGDVAGIAGLARAAGLAAARDRHRGHDAAEVAHANRAVDLRRARVGCLRRCACRRRGRSGEQTC